MNADKLAEALREIKSDMEQCDWTCERCGKDYGMCETDAYRACVEALAEHDAQPAQAAQPSADAEDWAGKCVRLVVEDGDHA